MQSYSPPTFPLYPIYLRVEGLRCVVVGGGAIGAAKAHDLLMSGATVAVISPELAPRWSELSARHAERLQFETRKYVSTDVDGAVVVVAATGDPSVDDLVYADAKRVGALVNVADVPHQCDFYNGSIVRRGLVAACIGTAGASPSLAVALRRRVEAAIPEGTEHIAESLRAHRPALLATHTDYQDRKTRLDRLVAISLARLDADESPVTESLVDQVLKCNRPCDPAACCLEAYE